MILINPQSQRLSFLEAGSTVFTARISTAKNGLGEQLGSEKTPRGQHEICEKIGAKAPINTVFKGRLPTGEIYSESLALEFPERDWILTRILWLAGLEPGRNLGGDVDTQKRYIYIHGTPDLVPLGEPNSRGCIRMHNESLIELFDRVSVQTKVSIENNSC